MIEPYYQSDHATLYLGDSRDVCRELPRRCAGLVVTDPPYGVKWQSHFRGDRFDNIAGDDGSLDVPAVLGEIVNQALPDRQHVYVFGFRPEDLKEPLKLGGTAELVWDKDYAGMGDLTLPWGPSWERVAFGAHTKGPKDRATGRGALTARLRSGSVLRVPRKGSNALNHPSEKPVPLMRMLIESSSVLGDTVLDPFAGTGATLVASVLMGRRTIGVELSESYADKAAQRLETAERIAREMDGV